MIYRKLKKAPVWALALAVAAALTASTALAAELPEELVPVGEAVGISLRTDGVLVSETTEFDRDGVKSAPARDAGIRPGDVITAINGAPVGSAADMMAILDSAQGGVTVTYLRDGTEHEADLTPYRDGDTSYLGVWVRDGLTGIGTVTYFDPESHAFGALGHSIADSATGAIVPLREGSIMTARITGVTKSRSGEPGQLGGAFDTGERLGTISKNCEVGIFGTAQGLDVDAAIPVAGAGEVRTGDATVISDASGERREYSVEITRVYSDGNGRDMMIKVTDPELIELTGGIVQGMSGSPIIQGGKLIGAVTHVMINDPRKGYGVFLENMLRAA